MRRVAPYYARADILAARFHGLYTWVSQITLMIAAFATVVAAVEVVVFHGDLLLANTEIGLLLIPLVAAGRRWQLRDRWINYRFLAERFRADYFTYRVCSHCSVWDDGYSHTTAAPLRREEGKTVAEETTSGALLSAAVGRRLVLRGGFTGAAGLAVAALIGCGSTKEGAKPAAGAPAAANAPAKPKVLNQGLMDALNNPNAKYPYLQPEPDTTPKKGGVLRHAWNYDIASMDPTVSTSNSTLGIANAVGDRLIDRAYGTQFNPLRPNLVPGLALTWELSPDGLNYTFKMTDKAKFHNKPPVNGRTMTAEDVRIVYDRYAKTGVSRAYFTNVDSMTVANPTTFVIKLKKPQPDFLVNLALRETVTYAPEMIDAGLLAKNQDSIGTNGFILTFAKAGDRISFVANKDYWRGEPYLEGIELKPLPGEAALDTRRAMFRTGQADFAEGIATTSRDVEAILASNPGTRPEALPVVRGVHVLGYQMNNPKWKDERIRQALSLGFDRDSFLKTIYNGEGQAVLPNLPWIYLFDNIPDTSVSGKWYKYDIAEAKKMLAAAGAENLAFEFLRTPNYTTDSALSVTIESMKKLGVTVTPKTQDVTTFNAQWQGQSYADTANGPNVGYTADTFYRDQIVSGGSLNRWNIKDSQLDQWAEQQSSELDPKKRKEILRKIWDRVNEQQYHLDGPGSAAGASLYPPYMRAYHISGVISLFSPGGDFGSHAYKAWFDK
ncbi:MAG: ABC transporter substrate-binding protein [Dehalococcoidia bacterium]|nr:ABC transporter substrate-binding protein [Dehalococcoidia bacterium]